MFDAFATPNHIRATGSFLSGRVWLYSGVNAVSKKTPTFVFGLTLHTSVLDFLSLKGIAPLEVFHRCHSFSDAIIGFDLPGSACQSARGIAAKVYLGFIDGKWRTSPDLARCVYLLLVKKKKKSSGNGWYRGKLVPFPISVRHCELSAGSVRGIRKGKTVFMQR